MYIPHNTPPLTQNAVGEDTCFLLLPKNELRFAAAPAISHFFYLIAKNPLDFLFFFFFKPALLITNTQFGLTSEARKGGMNPALLLWHTKVFLSSCLLKSKVAA
uniref:E3 ubiquitin-protein ligase UPL4 n=1 Tax=Rhizophora mucronata TaxID=61149 RepID=A0A2P2M422_RHIMU